MSKLKFRKRRKKDVYEILSEVAAVCMVIGILQMAGAEGTVKATGTGPMVYLQVIFGLAEVVLGFLNYRFFKGMHIKARRENRKKEIEIETRARERELQEGANEKISTILSQTGGNMSIKKGENPIKIVRYSKLIAFRDGVESNMQCMQGSSEEVRERAEQVAREHGCEVVAII